MKSAGQVNLRTMAFSLLRRTPLFPLAKKVANFLLNSKGLKKIFADADDGGSQAKRRSIAQEYIMGVGVEIGALHHPLPVSRNATVRYIDRLSTPELRRQYPELNDLPLVEISIITNGETLESVDNFSQDFVIANHFLEHCQNPLLAVENMLRVLKQSGILYLSIPDKRYSFDAAREITSYEHLENDYLDGGENSKKQHFEEWVRFVNNVTDETEVIRQVTALIDIDYSKLVTKINLVF